MPVDSKDIKVRWHPQYEPSAKKVIITGYRVYAYVGHPLLGVVRGSEHIVKTEREAKKLASEMRKRFK
ncbi:hypothetical protein LCGC14_0510400 [marine sediment metagenome]|uniref:Uncharacterized protein n=1 Tax=marine sediment metagenome TaxID=412755 RepID=A0A0F9S697_9ZZZZ